MLTHINRAQELAEHSADPDAMKQDLDNRFSFFLGNCALCKLCGETLQQMCNADEARNILADDIDMEEGCPDKIVRRGNSVEKIWGTGDMIPQHINFFGSKS